MSVTAHTIRLARYSAMERVDNLHDMPCGAGLLARHATPASARRPPTARLAGWLALPVLLLVITATSAAAATTTVAAATPVAPPSAPQERLPPPPNAGAVTWLPGSWRWTGVGGTEWEWAQGHYVTWPPAPTASEAASSPSLPSEWVGIDWESP